MFHFKCVHTSGDGEEEDALVAARLGASVAGSMSGSRAAGGKTITILAPSPPFSQNALFSPPVFVFLRYFGARLQPSCLEVTRAGPDRARID